VDNDGNISFPILGTLRVAGLTKREAEQMIEQKIRPYMSDVENPIVTVRMSSYSISVLGEVSRPGSYQVAREKISILEALAQAGDLTIYGVRDKVKLIREDANGQKEIHVLNLNDANLINSPYYYLQQNDIVYVEPNKVKARNSSVGQSTTLWFTATSILISLTSLLYNVLK
jgi:polysaccharide export outer membrane protein